MTMNANDLARTFCRFLEDAMTTGQMETVIERNAAETNPSICHTHDFCDANQVMLDALEVLWDRCEPIDVTNEATGNLINEAWAIAKAAEFCTEDIK